MSYKFEKITIIGISIAKFDTVQIRRLFIYLIGLIKYGDDQKLWAWLSCTQLKFHPPCADAQATNSIISLKPKTIQFYSPESKIRYLVPNLGKYALCTQCPQSSRRLMLHAY